MKFFINISGTHGYPEGLINHMVQAVSAFHYHLNYFYDANIPINLVNGPLLRGKSYKEKGKK